MPTDPACGAPAQRAAAGGSHDEQHPPVADADDASARHRLRHRPVVAAGPMEPGGGQPDSVARSRADGPVLGAVRPDRHPVAAARPAVALQGRPGHRGVELVDGAPPGRGGGRVRRILGRSRGRWAVVGRSPGRDACAHAGFPRSSPRPSGHPWTPHRPAVVAGVGAAPGQRCGAVLPVHDRQQGRGRRRAGRTGLAATRTRARRRLPAW